jgi:4,5-DOPA dioxygenase extradiol
MYEPQHPAYAQLQSLGREITTVVRPKAIVVISAHWQSDRPKTIEVNTSENEALLYDYYGFPRHYYAEKYPNKGSTKIAGRVMEILGENGIQSEGVERGLDHGVFVPFKAMFGNGNELARDIPIVQVSMWDDDRDAASHIRLGEALKKLREEQVCIVCSGMSVHNLRDMMILGLRTDKALPYAVSFDAALKEAVETNPGDERDENMVELLKRGDARKAHPSFEHLMPIHVAVGAAGDDVGRQVWTKPEGSMAWAQYRFGEVSA